MQKYLFVAGIKKESKPRITRRFEASGPASAFLEIMKDPEVADFCYPQPDDLVLGLKLLENDDEI